MVDPNMATPPSAQDYVDRANAGAGSSAPPAGSSSTDDPPVRMGGYNNDSRPAPTETIGGREFQHGMATPPTPKVVARSGALLEPYRWSASRLKKEIAKARSYGFDVGDDTLQSFLPIWQKMVDSSIDFNTANPSKNVTPFDMYSLLGSKSAGKALAEKDTPGAGAADPTKPVTTTTHSSDVTQFSAGQVHGVLNDALSTFLGRDASDSEVEDFLSRANALSAADPAQKVETSTGVANAADDQRQVTSSSVTDPGFTQDDLVQAAKDQAQADPNYGETQAAMTIAPWLFSALQSPVG